MLDYYYCEYQVQHCHETIFVQHTTQHVPLKHLKDELTGQQPCCNTTGNSVSNIGALSFIINNMIQSQKLFLRNIENWRPGQHPCYDFF